jgi:MFS family permease
VHCAQAQSEAGWLGFWGAIAGLVGGVLLGVTADRFHSHMKQMVMGCCAVGAVAFTVFAMACDSVIPQSNGLLYCMSILCGFLINSLVRAAGGTREDRRCRRPLGWTPAHRCRRSMERSRSRVPCAPTPATH